MKDKIFGVLQRVGRSLMLPLAILPVAGLFLGIGGSFTNPTTIETYKLGAILGEGTILHSLLTILNATGSIIFENLPLIFAIGVAIGMAKHEKAVAALAATISFFVMHASINALIELTGGEENLLAGSTASVLGIKSLQMGVFGGIIVGLGVAGLHNKFYKIELPRVLSFFGGTRFVPIISAIVYVFVGILMFYVWPFVQRGIFALGGLVYRSGYAGTFVYGLIERALIPFGLHHVFYLPFWQTSLGGNAMIDGVLIEGAQNIFFAELGSPNTVKFSVSATRFMSGKFPLMIFGLPGAALAMYRCAKDSKKKVVGGLLLSAALTSMLTGITEPLEFTFLFVAPVLYVIHSILAGLAYMLMHMLKVGVGMTFSGGLIDLTLFGILQGNYRTNWVYVLVVGIVYFIVYYFLFSFLIKKFDFKTPGREEDTQETKLYTRADVNARKEGKSSSNKGSSQDNEVSRLILAGLGGKGNVDNLDCCATRLRVTVNDATKVNDALLKQSGAAGIVKRGNGVQVIYGPVVTVIKSKLEAYMSSEESNADTIENLIIDNVEELHEEGLMPENADEKCCVTVFSPCKGTAIPLDQVPDDVFSKGILGQGMAINPTDGVICSPCNGTVDSLFDTKHAIALKSDDGADILIHIGLDTVELEGKFFEVHVSKGDRIRVGDKLITADVNAIRNAGYETVTPVVVCNMDNFTKMKAMADGDVDISSELFNLFKNGDKK